MKRWGLTQALGLVQTPELCAFADLTFDYDVAYGTDDDGLTLNLEPTEEAP
jgi:hypothetical protein